MANKDYYATLGVSKSASKDEIKSAYRKLAKKYHPDNKETGDEAKFKEVQEAYDILYDDQKRKTYDQFGSAAFEQAGTNPGSGNPFDGFSSAGGADFSDIFSSFFGGGTRQRQASNSPTKGNDRLMRVKVNFMDTIMGKDITLNYTYDKVCDHCHGSGAESPSDVHTCSNCHGTGYVKVRRQTLFGVMESQETCSQCNGTGKNINKFCTKCKGNGYIKTKTDLAIHIPAGINEGQQIFVSGKGERGYNGGPNGDLYVEIVVNPHEYFTRKGNDIYVTCPLDFIDAILGTSLTVPTVYGQETIKIPEGTQPNTVMRLKDKGVKDLRSGRPGDEYVTLEIKTPKNLTAEQKELLHQFRGTTPKDSKSKKKGKKGLGR